MKIIVLQQRKNRLFKSKLVSAMIYPAIIFVLSTIIGMAIFIFVIPRLASVYSALNIELPLITQVMINLSIFLSNYWFIVIPLGLILTYLTYFYLFINPKTKRTGQKILFSLGPFRNVIINLEVARLGFLLGTLIEAGLPILDAISSMSRSSDFYAYTDFYDFLEQKIQDGESFQQTFAKFKNINKIIPVPIQQIIISAERSGKLKESLLQIHETFEERIDTSSRNLAVVLEPLMLIIVWLGVVFVALSVIFPIYNLVGGVSQTTRDTLRDNSDSQQETTRQDAVGQVRVLNSLDEAAVYDFPDEAGFVLEVGRAGVVYDFLKLEDGWYQVFLSGSNKTGWISAESVEDITAP
jgi:type II secretory pathway component PulF